MGDFGNIIWKWFSYDHLGILHSKHCVTLCNTTYHQTTRAIAEVASNLWVYTFKNSWCFYCYELKLTVCLQTQKKRGLIWQRLRLEAHSKRGQMKFKDSKKETNTELSTVLRASSTGGKLKLVSLECMLNCSLFCQVSFQLNYLNLDHFVPSRKELKGWWADTCIC